MLSGWYTFDLGAFLCYSPFNFTNYIILMDWPAFYIIRLFDKWMFIAYSKMEMRKERMSHQ